MSLFLKIFVWFWLAMALIGVALMIAIEITQSDPVEARWRDMTGTAVRIYAQTATEMYERDGPDALVLYLQRVEQTAQMRARVFDERGVEVSGRGTTPETKRLADVAHKMGNSEEPVFDFPTAPARVALIAQRVYGRGGTRYVLVSEVPRSRFAALLAEPDALAFRLGAVLLTAGLVCYGLARYLAAPMETLRTGVRRLASGDLSARVGSHVGARRDEIADLSRDFDLMAERIESLVTSQRRLLGDISHELRSPLARLSVALGLARRRAGEEASGVTSALDRIEREAERLNELIGQLLTLTHLETDPQELEKTRIDLQELVGQVVADADFEAQGRNRSVRLIAKDECSVLGNNELLRSAIENVVRNGVRYTAENTSVEVILQCSSEGGASGAVISVRDHGRGVPEEVLGELFRPFYRVASARDRQTGGTGLGLAITERAVRLHGGTVKAANAAGGGLVVEIRLPATIA
ncbi:MAG: ATP-binding protein [Acidobacteriota bacterium]|nr:ATP-binding protein [Acidobacteriota bacterium]